MRTFEALKQPRNIAPHTEKATVLERVSLPRRDET